MTAREAHAFLAGLTVGEAVLVNDSASPMTVARAMYHQDGCGAWESYGVYLTYGPGRYSTFISAASVGAGFNRVRRFTGGDVK